MTFDELLRTLPVKVLKRPLTDSERSELLEIASVIEMKTVEEYLYLILTFKLCEDKLGVKINALAAVEENINSTLKDGAAKVLSEVAADIKSKLSDNIASEALKAAGIMKEYQQLRGQMIIVVMMALAMTLGFFLGTMGIAPIINKNNALHALLNLPIGWVFIFCSAAYGLLWSHDNWKMITRTSKGKCILGSQVLVLLWLLIMML